MAPGEGTQGTHAAGGVSHEVGRVDHLGYLFGFVCRKFLRINMPRSLPVTCFKPGFLLRSSCAGDDGSNSPRGMA